jgi:transcriptional regulator with XRE-family HTH domain
MAVYVSARDVTALRDRIVATHTTQVALARAANTSPARISQIVSGRATAITVTLAAAIERALGVPPGTLFGITVPAELVEPYISPTTGAA